jgi:hypothetical protein
MRLDTAFRLSFYLTLALACVCLGYAVRPQLPEFTFLTLPVALALLLAYRLEGRWVLPVWAANLLALLITGVVGIWAASILLDAINGRLEAPAFSMLVLPYLGLFLLILMLAKLFRPKRTYDYWFLHGMAFMSVAVACTLDNDFLFGVLLVPYLACTLWALTLFHLYRGRSVNGLSVAEPVPWPRLGVWQVGRASVLMLGLAALAFLATPRYAVVQAETNKASLTQFHTGLADAVVDLRRSGTIRLNTAVAFEVAVTDAAGQPKNDLNPGQYWRGAALNYYDDGRWLNRGIYLFRPLENSEPRSLRPHAGPREGLPDLGPGQYFLTFDLPNRSPTRRLILANPVALAENDDRLPVSFTRRGSRLPVHYLEMEVIPPGVSRREKWVYVQASAAPAEPGLGWPVRLPHGDRSIADTPLRRPPPVPGLREFTDDVLNQLVAQGRLSEADLERQPGGALIETSHERVARALEWYLASSGEYSYSLRLPRHDRNCDPAFDFLVNAREGHCERFAAGLALMLRSQGIPARVVVGYHGAEALGNGHYLVRNSHAHSWVEVLVRRQSPSGPEWRWLTLEPTPSAEAAEINVPWWRSWWRDVEQSGGFVWNNFVIEYTAQQRDQAVAVLLARAESFSWVSILALIAAFVVVFLLWFRWRRKRSVIAAARTELAGYGRLLAILARHCRLRPQPSQTPHEFAEVAAQRLTTDTHTAAVASVPAEVARLYYRVRYSRQPLNTEEAAHLDGELGRLEAALRS